MKPTNIYNPKCERIDRDELAQLQIEKLQSTLNRVYRNVDFYRTAFDAHRVNLETVKDLARLAELPFTTRQDLQSSYPYDMFAMPLRDIVRIHSATGTTGAPIVAGYTRNDLRNWSECTARLLAAAGVSEHDVVQIALNYSLYPGTFGFHQGVEHLGASVIPASLSTSVEKQLVIMRDFKTTVLISTPSHAVTLAAELEALRVHPERLQLRLGIFGGEPLDESRRQQLQQRLRLTATAMYSINEILGPGVAGECGEHNGLHINEDHFIVEIVDPVSLRTVKPGEEGELVLTTLTHEGSPLIRYRTGDRTRILPEPCPCGRTFLRMANVTARTDDMIFFQGIGIFPSQIEQILYEVDTTRPDYQIVLDQEAGQDTMELRVSISDKVQSLDQLKTLENLRKQIARRITTVFDVVMRVTFVEPQTLQQAGNNARVWDKRLDVRTR